MQSKEGREIWSQTRGTSAQPRPMPVTGGERPDRQKMVSRETGWSGHPSACAGGCHRAGMWACPATHIPSKKSSKSRFEHGILQFLNVGNDLKHFPKHSVGQTKHVCRPGGSVRSRARHRPALCSPRHTGPAGHHATPGSAPKRRGRCALASRIAGDPAGRRCSPCVCTWQKTLRAPGLATQVSVLHTREVSSWGTLSIWGIVAVGNSRSYASGVFEEGVPSFAVDTAP